MTDNGKKPATNSLFVSDTQKWGTPDGDELLGLCSGNFSDAGVSWNAAGRHDGLFTPEPSASNSNSILDVLSGKFTSAQQQSGSNEFELARLDLWNCCRNAHQYRFPLFD